jgi:hypothetical protein
LRFPASYLENRPNTHNSSHAFGIVQPIIPDDYLPEILDAASMPQIWYSNQQLLLQACQIYQIERL